MANENALFEDDFIDEFADDFDDAQVAEAAPAQVAVDIDAPMKDISPIDELFAAPAAIEGGDRPIAAIAIRAFCERPDTMELIATAGKDRRMSSVTLDITDGGLDAAIAHLQENATPNLLIVESSAPSAQMIAKIDELASHCDEGVEVLVIGAMNDISLYRQLMARGVSEYLVPPVQPLGLIRSISTLFSDPEKPFIGKSISVVGAKGGVGASTIAHNLAWALTENVGVSAAMVDLDLSFGTTALDFNADGQQSVADALLAPERADEAVISRLLHKVTDRLSLFTAPATISQIMDIQTDAYQTVIEGVRRTMPYVVLDLPHLWDRWVHNTLVSSDEVILVCQPDLASLRNGKNMIDQLKNQRPNDVPPRLVLNMAGVPQRPEIPVKDFAAAIGIEPEVILPWEPKLFGTAANNGQMISETDAASKSSLAIDHIASLLTGRVIAPQQKSFLQKILKK